MEKAKIETIVNRKDQFGNRLSYEEKTNKLSLSQSNEPTRWRPIGKLVSEDTLMIYCKYEKESDKYRKYKAWSVYYIILDICDAIRYETEEFVYYISKNDLIQYGISVIDRGHGNGRKIVCPIRYWTIMPKNKSYKKLLNSLGYEWFDELKNIFKSSNMKSIGEFVRQERKTNVVYPSAEKVFAPFRATPYTAVKVVLFDIGPLESDNADGLAFSYNEDIGIKHKVTTDLLDLIEETVYEGFNLNKDTDLNRWAAQGVLLLNSRYTCNHFGKTSHADKGWEEFNKTVLNILCADTLHTPIVFILLGEDNIKTYHQHLTNIVNDKHLIICGNYPGKDSTPIDPNTYVFNKCNDYLQHNHLQPIQW